MKIIRKKSFLERFVDKWIGELFEDPSDELEDYTMKKRIQGVIFGQAIGDALGLGTEFMSRKEVMSNYPKGIDAYSQIVQDWHRKRWRPGEWTDDTDMMLCIANAMLEDQEIKLDTVARNFKNWFKQEPMGIGRYTYNVLSIADYEKEPMESAKVMWELSNRNSAANGALMRTSVVGLWRENISFYAEQICRLTHTDPRCVGACVILSELIHHWVWRNRELPFEDIVAIGRLYDTRIEPYLMAAKENDDIRNLALDEETSMGYTLKTLSAAIWCLYHVGSFKEGLLYVVNAGGDADTNAAVSCSLLGAKYGFDAIPNDYIEGLCNKNVLYRISKSLIKLLSSNQ